MIRAEQGDQQHIRLLLLLLQLQQYTQAVGSFGKQTPPTRDCASARLPCCVVYKQDVHADQIHNAEICQIWWVTAA